MCFAMIAVVTTQFPVALSGEILFQEKALAGALGTVESHRRRTSRNITRASRLVLISRHLTPSHMILSEHLRLKIVLLKYYLATAPNVESLRRLADGRLPVEPRWLCMTVSRSYRSLIWNFKM